MFIFPLPPNVQLLEIPESFTYLHMCRIYHINELFSGMPVCCDNYTCERTNCYSTMGNIQVLLLYVHLQLSDTQKLDAADIYVKKSAKEQEQLAHTNIYGKSTSIYHLK